MAPSSPRRVRKKKAFTGRQSRARKPKKHCARTSLLASAFDQRPDQQILPNSGTPSGSVRIPESNDPLEKNIFERAPLPDGYVFVPKGDVYITRHCRVKTKESHQVVYVVYVSLAGHAFSALRFHPILTSAQNRTGKRIQGIRVPAEIHSNVSELAVLTAHARASAVEVRDTKFIARGRELLRSQFPLMPDESLEVIMNHSFLKGSGRVGRTSTTTDNRKATLAVEAHIRHKHTPYESLLAGGVDRKEARETVWPSVQAIKKAWEGRGDQPAECLTIRSVQAAT
ncbi:uncharacterized protein N7459_007723 [Penicillium hispanicum]|uniref:uncharacterized protein n=1 Tax=Penicillium hispanicum TaxID=1080232 RepID=UPI00254127A2|nr:uncharacterized protein N7459_007723 [Penicillium hispanicum]KAJ5578759.1 hypothetical protein N7459_007723 [Penicillium hispanicum]